MHSSSVRDTFWMRQAACRDVDPEIFFPIGSAPSRTQLALARHVCSRCPVTEMCLNYALDTGQSAGVWAGTTEQERRALRETVP
ncbi:WhiB family transcriptional regulator [Sinosporangium siamense]|uniref:WhiB family transcriptional regulator n=1 Tax=Sinosporangium siamense TaxID=1367973 RepID=UPI0035A2218B